MANDPRLIAGGVMIWSRVSGRGAGTFAKCHAAMDPAAAIRLQIPMHDAAFMRGLERVGDLPCELERLGYWIRALFQTIFESFAVHIFEDEAGYPVFGVLSVNLCNVRVIERRQYFRLALCTSESLRVACELIRQDLWMAIDFAEDYKRIRRRGKAIGSTLRVELDCCRPEW